MRNAMRVANMTRVILALKLELEVVCINVWCSSDLMIESRSRRMIAVIRAVVTPCRELVRAPSESGSGLQLEARLRAYEQCSVVTRERCTFLEQLAAVASAAAWSARAWVFLAATKQAVKGCAHAFPRFPRRHASEDSSCDADTTFCKFSSRSDVALRSIRSPVSS